MMSSRSICRAVGVSACAAVLVAVGAGTRGAWAQAGGAPAGGGVAVTRGAGDPVAPPKPGDSLLRFPELRVGADGKNPPQGFWATQAAGMGQGTFRFTTDEQGRVIATMTTNPGQGPARMQVGTACVAPAIERFWGQVVELTVDVKGNITNLGATTGTTVGGGALLQVQVTGPQGGGGRTYQVGPFSTVANNRRQLNARSGAFEWTTLTTRLRVPENTQRLDMLMYIANSEGEVSWRNPRMSVAAPGAEVDERLPERWMTTQEAAAREIERISKANDKLWADLDKQINVPEASELYALPADLAGRRPRLFVHGEAGKPGAFTLATLRERWKADAYAKFVGPISVYADLLSGPGFDALPKPDGTVNLDREDPLRGWVDATSLLTVVAAAESDPAKRAVRLDAVKKWLDRLMDYGVTPRNLPLAQGQLAFALAYDWLGDELGEDRKARMRRHMMAMAARSLDLSNPHVNWIFARQFVANHLWFNYMGRTVTALTLWGEKDVDQALLKSYLDEAAVNYWVVSQTHSPEGMPHEGFLYQDYGLRPYTDFLSITEHTMGWKYDLIDKPANRTMGVRIHASLPGAGGFMVTSDAKAEQFSGYPYFYWVASRFREPLAQTLAEQMRVRAQAMDAKPETFLTAYTHPARFTDINSWRALLHYDPTVPTTDVASLPLHFADVNMGFFTARSGWGKDDVFFGLKAGTLSGKAVSEKFGPMLGIAVSGHCYPEQGNFVLQVGNNDYLPNVEYSRAKATTNHNLVVFGGRDKDAGKWTGQVGEGQAWLMGPLYMRFKSEAEVLKFENAPDRHYYLADLGGLYRLEDSRAEGKVFFPTYRREITFLPEGLVATVDHVRSEHARTVRLNLLTGGVSGEVRGDRVSFAFKDGTKGQVLTASDAGASLEAKPGEVLSWGRNDRYIVSLTTPEVTSATFVSVIGPEALVGSAKVEKKGDTWVLSRPGKPDLVIGSADALKVERK